MNGIAQTHVVYDKGNGMLHTLCFVRMAPYKAIELAVKEYGVNKDKIKDCYEAVYPNYLGCKVVSVNN